MRVFCVVCRNNGGIPFSSELLVTKGSIVSMFNDEINSEVVSVLNFVILVQGVSKLLGIGEKIK